MHVGTAVRLKSRIFFYSNIPSGSKPVLNIQVAIKFLWVFLLALHSVAELLRETENTSALWLNVKNGLFAVYYSCIHENRDHWSNIELCKFGLLCVCMLGRSCCCTGVVTGEFEGFGC